MYIEVYRKVDVYNKMDYSNRVKSQILVVYKFKNINNDINYCYYYNYNY